jgi:para-nitrobenzyl esterase
LPAPTGGEAEAQSEDCLVLNVFTPGADDGARPVMVYFHGGQWTVGSGANPRWEGSRLATRGDVVVVTVNTRLGYLGFLHLAELGGDEYADSGNVGALDLRASLEWVRDNIAAFGGDPGNVTIFGQSGGGWKVCTLLGMPSAKGLFHRAIVQSGPQLCTVNPDSATAVAKEMMSKVGVATVEELANAPVDELIAAQIALGDSAPIGPVRDGRTFSEGLFDPEAAPSSLDVPLLIGTCRDEMALFMGRMDPERFSEHALERFATQQFGEGWEKVLAAHGSDVAFVFDNLATDGMRFVEHTPQAQALADRASEAWLAFARSGDPNHDGLPAWPRYDTDRRATMIFDDECVVIDDPSGAERRAWDQGSTPGGW